MMAVWDASEAFIQQYRDPENVRALNLIRNISKRAMLIEYKEAIYRLTLRAAISHITGIIDSDTQLELLLYTFSVEFPEEYELVSILIPDVKQVNKSSVNYLEQLWGDMEDLSSQLASFTEVKLYEKEVDIERAEMIVEFMSKGSPDPSEVIYGPNYKPKTMEGHLKEIEVFKQEAEALRDELFVEQLMFEE